MESSIHPIKGNFTVEELSKEKAGFFYCETVRDSRRTADLSTRGRGANRRRRTGAAPRLNYQPVNSGSASSSACVISHNSIVIISPTSAPSNSSAAEKLARRYTHHRPACVSGRVTFTHGILRAISAGLGDMPGSIHRFVHHEAEFRSP